jgi:DNA sulfur modification protein DndD
MEQEFQQQQINVAKDLLQERNQRLLEFITQLKLSARHSKQIQEFVTQETQDLTGFQEASWLDADPSCLQQLITLLEQELPSQANQMRDRLDRLEKSQEEIESTERYLATAASPEAYERLSQEVKHAQTELVRLKTESEQAKIKYEQLSQAIDRTKQELVEYSQLAIDRKHNEHLLGAITTVQDTLKVFKQRLKLRKLNQLETLVTECFLYLLHKPNLVHRVQIDTETFRLDLFDYEGQPVPKHRLSAGEKQLLAISLLWGLARASGRKLPVAIDTPLGRLDSSHRSNLVKRYFPQASHQVLLFSTDTEIGKSEVKLLRQEGAIAREYLLQHDSSERQTNIKKGYFC